MPSLESLHIGYRERELQALGAPSTPLVEPVTRTSPVPLPHLRDFFFSGTPTHYTYIVPSLSIPAVASRNIELYEDYWYGAGEVPEGWTPPGYPPYSYAVSPKVLVTPSPRRRLESSTFDDAVDLDEHSRPAPVLSIRYNIPPVDDDAPVDEFEYERDIVHAMILPLISTIARMFPTDAVNHLHLSSNVSILPQTVESDDDSDTDENNEEWTPPFLEWSEVLSLHVEGKGMAEWLVPHVSKTRQLMFREGRKWRKETSPVVFPKLQELMLDKIDRAFSPQSLNEGCYDEIWSHRLKVDVVEVRKCWESVLQARAACAGKKLQRLVLVGGEVWGQLEWRKWCAVLRTSGWIENNKVEWQCDSTAGDPEDLLCDRTFTREELDLMEEGWDYEWHRRICAGLCHSFCDRFLYT
ncbi:uncharacterized protein STEHIDRAFT_106535 [Stereum hirsutum FP-91666 SS1]|uniref:uncharacterized protein n=1 Tax=Stereum hirsutum (strain FP-91666) TaxID=721885 RepID=UPI000440D11F|nr:uncharacterized protein STEHIDRAFT_106535 [Stereum hirsutum FP-91666 SS1]EIM91838.1 hypothetical protein STEHIDRAFT_106535 [Stereum hirsutum FP-91666 SS1]